MSADVVAAVGSGAGKIGRYFTVVSALPAAVFVSYVYLLLRTKSWTEPVQWSGVVEFRPGDLVVVGITALVLALAMNPLQFTLIQLFEGYWGSSALATELTVVRTIHHRRRREALERKELAAIRAQGDDRRRDLSRGTASVHLVRGAIVAAESQRALASYPDDLADVLPTRLGNVLRRYETAIRRPYGLDPLLSVPRLAMLAGEREVAYVENQRVQLELAIRTAFLAIIATCVTVVLMSQQGLWMLVALGPYAIAFFAYRGAVAVAHEYGTSLAVLTDLTRFALYDRLRLPQPVNTDAERSTNETLMRMFGLKDDRSLQYVRSAPADVIGSATSAHTGQERDEKDP